MKVILLAAGRGKRFGKKTANLPKCLIPLRHGETLLSRYLDSFRQLGLKKIVIVVGHENKQIRYECGKNGAGLNIRFLINRRYREGSIVSLARAAKLMKEDCLVMDADVYFAPQALKTLLRSPRSAFLLDPRSKSSGEEMMVMAKGARLARVAKKKDPSLKTVGEATGFFLVKKRDATLLAKIVREMVKTGKTGLEYEEAYNELMKKTKVGFEKIRGFWTEMDFEEDLKKIRRQFKV